MAKSKVAFFVQLVPEWADGVNTDGTRNLWDAKAARLTTRQPESPIPGAVVVPVTLWVEASLFGPVEGVHAEVQAEPDGGVELRPAE